MAEQKKQTIKEKNSPSTEKTDQGFAVIKTGGKQYTVSVGDSIKIEMITGDYSEGDSISFDTVLAVDTGSKTTVGTPYVEKAKVGGVIEQIGRSKKIDTSRSRAKSRYFKRSGHRQSFMKVRIESIV